MNQARSSWSKSFTPILVEKLRKIIAFGWPRNTHSESWIWQKFHYWCGDQGLLRVCAKINWGRIGSWLSLIMIRATLRKNMALSKNWYFILYLHSSKKPDHINCTQAESINFHIFLLVVKCKWWQPLKITRFLLSTKILSFWHKLTLLFK